MNISKWRSQLREMNNKDLEAERDKYRKTDKARFNIVNGMLAQRIAHGNKEKIPSTAKSIRAPDKLWTRIEKIVNRENISFPDFVRQALENECLEYEEDE